MSKAGGIAHMREIQTIPASDGSVWFTVISAFVALFFITFFARSSLKNA